MSTTLGGTGAKCWITQNLGATTQAVLATDANEVTAGWYWQFNRKQGIQMRGINTRTPNTTWNTLEDNTFTGWDPANDPCTLELGSGWRIPTNTEWTNADATGSWVNYTGTYSSGLELHAAGYLVNNSGGRSGQGTIGFYWSSTQNSATNGYCLRFDISSSYITNFSKAYGFSVRCLKD